MTENTQRPNYKYWLISAAPGSSGNTIMPMRRMFMGVCLVVAWTGTTSASVLSNAAASMQPGTWLQITTSNINPTLTGTGGASGFIFGYADSIKWDPVTRQLFYVGQDHGEPDQTQAFVSYSDDTNSWSTLPSTSWMHVGLTPSHGYDHM